MIIGWIIICPILMVLFKLGHMIFKSKTVQRWLLLD